LQQYKSSPHRCKTKNNNNNAHGNETNKRKGLKNVHHGPKLKRIFPNSRPHADTDLIHRGNRPGTDSLGASQRKRGGGGADTHTHTQCKQSGTTVAEPQQQQEKRSEGDVVNTSK